MGAAEYFDKERVYVMMQIRLVFIGAVIRHGIVPSLAIFSALCYFRTQVPLAVLV